MAATAVEPRTVARQKFEDAREKAPSLLALTITADPMIGYVFDEPNRWYAQRQRLCQTTVLWPAGHRVCEKIGVIGPFITQCDETMRIKA